LGILPWSQCGGQFAWPNYKSRQEVVPLIVASIQRLDFLALLISGFLSISWWNPYADFDLTQPHLFSGILESIASVHKCANTISTKKTGFCGFVNLFLPGYSPPIKPQYQIQDWWLDSIIPSGTLLPQKVLGSKFKPSGVQMKFLLALCRWLVRSGLLLCWLGGKKKFQYFLFYLNSPYLNK